MTDFGSILPARAGNCGERGLDGRLLIGIIHSEVIQELFCFLRSAGGCKHLSQAICRFRGIWA
jgi:hypothetical protein